MESLRYGTHQIMRLMDRYLATGNRCNARFWGHSASK